VLLQSVELLDGRENVNELLDSSAEQIELAKDGGRVEVELLFLQKVVDLALDHVVLLLVGVVQAHAVFQFLDQFFGISVPDLVDVLAAFLDSGLAVVDHLVGDLHE